MRALPSEKLSSGTLDTRRKRWKCNKRLSTQDYDLLSWPIRTYGDGQNIRLSQNNAVLDKCCTEGYKWDGWMELDGPELYAERNPRYFKRNMLILAIINITYICYQSLSKIWRRKKHRKDSTFLFCFSNTKRWKRANVEWPFSLKSTLSIDFCLPLALFPIFFSHLSELSGKIWQTLPVYKGKQRLL